MDKVRIFIDHYAGDDELEFVKRLKERIGSIKYDFYLQTFSDISSSYDEDDDPDAEKPTVLAINNATIVIPIISETYISFVTDQVEEGFDSIIDSSNRFLLPVIYKPASWARFKWVVRSKLTPVDEIPLVDRATTDIDAAINSLVKMISNILEKLQETGKHHIVEQQLLKTNGSSVFISHDHDDADFAELLQLKLEKNGLNGWIDSERLKIGQDWREEIDAGIEGSLAVIAIMTPEARKSEYVTYEWAFAWGKGKNIFPIMLKQTQLHPRLESLQYLDFTNRAIRPWDDLIESIKGLL